MHETDYPRDTIRHIHVIAPVDSPFSVIDRIMANSSGPLTIVDLSAGDIRTTSGLRREWNTPTDHRSKGSTEWIESADLAAFVGDSSREAYVTWVREMANLPLEGGKSIKELFTYNRELSLWWLSGMSEKHPVSHPYRWLFFMVFAIRRVCSERLGDLCCWQFWVSDDATGQALQAALPDSEQSAIHLVPSGGPENIQLPKRSFPLLGRNSPFWRWYRSLARAVRELSRHTSSHFKSHPRIDPIQKEEPARPLVLFHTMFPHSWAEFAQHERFLDEIVCFDRYFGEAPWALKAEGFDVGWLPVFDSDEEEAWRKASAQQNLMDVADLMKMSGKTFRKLVRQALGWIILFGWYFGLKRIDRRWCFEDIPLGYWLRLDFAYLCSGGALEQISKIERLRSALRTTKPVAVIYRDECYRTGRHLTVGGSGITELIGTQHALIDREHTVYQVQTNDRCSSELGSSRDYVHCIPLPDRFVAFGDYTASQLQSWGTFPIDRIAVIGGLRFDGMVRRWTSFNSLEYQSATVLRNHLGLKPDLPIVLLCTGLAKAASRWVEMTIDALRLANLEAQIAVKLHQYHGHPSMVLDIARHRKFKPLVVFEDSLEQLIQLADIVITGPSTVVLESCLAGTPAAVIETIKGYPIYPFAEDDLAAPVADAQGLASVISETVTTYQHSRKASERRWPHRLGAHLHNLDGNACQRLAQVLRSLGPF